MAVDNIARGLAKAVGDGVASNKGDIIVVEGRLDIAEGKITINEGDIISLGNRVDVLESAQSNTIVEYKNTVILDSDSNQVLIGIAEFDKDTDSLLVFVNSTYIEVVEDYTIPDNTMIEKVTGDWDNGTVFNFIVIKKEIFTGVIDGGGA
jgi:hypothetical protein